MRDEGEANPRAMRARDVTAAAGVAHALRTGKVPRRAGQTRKVAL